MEKKDITLPNPEQINYGHEMKSIGYERGYNKCLLDLRRRKSKKEYATFQEFCLFLEYLNDLLWENRRK